MTSAQGVHKARTIRQIPVITPSNKAFWTGGAHGHLMIVHCNECATYTHPPRPRCSKCGGANVAPTPTPSEGIIKTFTVNHQAWRPGLKTPYVIAVIELSVQKGLYVVTNIVGCEPTEIRSGMFVRAMFERVDDVWIPLFFLKERKPCDPNLP